MTIGEGASRGLDPFSLLTKELIKNSSLPLNISSTSTVKKDHVHLFKGLAVRLGDAEVLCEKPLSTIVEVVSL